MCYKIIVVNRCFLGTIPLDFGTFNFTLILHDLKGLPVRDYYPNQSPCCETDNIQESCSEFERWK